jgi:hypothetical protein
MLAGCSPSGFDPVHRYGGSVRRDWRLFGVAATLLAGAVVVSQSEPSTAAASCAPSPSGAAELNQWFGSPGLGAVTGQEGYGGGDYPHAYALPDGRVLWLFQDLHFSNDNTLGATDAAHNAGLVQSGSCFTILGSRGGDYVGDSETFDSRRWFWPLDGEMGRDGRLWVFFVEMENPSGKGAGVGALPTGTWLARIDPSSLAVESFERAPDGGAGLFGWSVASDDRWSYLFGHCYRQFLTDAPSTAAFDPACMPHTYVARVPLGDFLAQPEYWTGSGWSIHGVPAPVLSRGHANPMSVQWFGDTWVSVTKIDDWWGASLIVDRASAPQGPWETVRTVNVVGDRKCDQCGNYGASLLPWLDAQGAMTVAMSNGAPFELWRANASLYRPTFYSFAVPAATAPLAAAAPPKFPVPAGDAGFSAVDPVRLVDTRNNGQPFPRLTAGDTVRLDLRDVAPPGTTAVALNLTTAHSDDGFVTVHACSSPRPETSNLNPSPNGVVTNSTIVPIGDGEVCFWSYGATDLVVDLNGWLSTSSDVGLEPVTARRLVDTRSGLGGSTRLAADQTIVVPVVPAGSPVTAVQLNLTAVQPGADGFVTAWPCGTPLPTVSNLNPAAGVTRPNLVNVRVGEDGTVCLYTKSETDLLVDLLAEYRPDAPARFAAIDPLRILDTRRDPRPAHAGQSVVVALGDAVAAQVNVTATNTAAPGFMTVYPCLAGPLPTASNLNFGAAESTANSALMRPGRGYGCVWASTTADVVVDVFGVWS